MQRFADYTAHPLIPFLYVMATVNRRTVHRPKDKLCPECGEFTAFFDRVTGWCLTCATEYNKHTRSRAEQFLLDHADHIEHYMLRGYTFSGAIDMMRDEIQRYRTCASCGGFIERAGPNAVFCRKRPKCRSYARRYAYLYTRTGRSKSEALAIVLTQLTGGSNGT